MERNADDIALLAKRLEQEIVSVYRRSNITHNDIANKDYVEIKLPKILFGEDQQKTDEFYDELVEDLWWMKFYDRTFFIVKPDLWIGIKNTISDEEQWNIINKYIKE
jgi:hypothetical protein